MHRTPMAVLGIVLATLLTCASGCIALGGGSKITNPTLGEELTALKISHDQGAVSDEEYNNAKAKLLNSPRK